LQKLTLRLLGPFQEARWKRSHRKCLWLSFRLPSWLKMRLC
jgi:hypothetical protein